MTTVTLEEAYLEHRLQNTLNGVDSLGTSSQFSTSIVVSMFLMFMDTFSSMDILQI